MRLCPSSSQNPQTEKGKKKKKENKKEFFMRPDCLLWWRWPPWHHRVVQRSIVVPMILLQALGTLLSSGSGLGSSFIYSLLPLSWHNLLTSMWFHSSRRETVQDLSLCCDKTDHKLKDEKPGNRSLMESNHGAWSDLKSLLHGNVSFNTSPAMCPPCMSSALSLSCRELLMGWDLFFSPCCPFKPVMAILINLPGCWQPDCSSQGLRGYWVIFLLFQLFPKQPLI